MDFSVRYSEARRITLIGAGKNTLLAIVKILFGLTGHSHALFADGVHSLSDLLIDALVLLASRFGSRAADREHPYGHGRIETAATLLLAFMMSLAGVGIILDAGMETLGIRLPVRPDFYVLLVALFSVLLNEALYQYTHWVGERVKSSLLLANAWHHRSDSASSLVVLIGAGAAWFGFMRLDAIAAIIVGVMIIKMAWRFGWNSVKELIDTGLDQAIVERIKNNIVAVPGVRALHQLRTRSVGGSIFLDVHILVSPTISVSEGHFIGQQVHFHLLQAMPGIVDVTVHVDPEDDEVAAPSRELPARGELITMLKQKWRDLIPTDVIETARLHYLGGKIYIEIKLPLTLLNSGKDKQQLIEQLRSAVANTTTIAVVDVLFQ